MRVRLQGATLAEARSAAIEFLEKTKPKKARGPAGTYRSTYGDTSGLSTRQSESWLGRLLARAGISKNNSGGSPA